MSALLVDDLYVPVPTRPQPARWRHVEGGPQARPQLGAVPSGRRAGVAAPRLRQVPAMRPATATEASRGWQLTDRGIAVVVVFFLALLATAAVVLVSSFLAVSDASLPQAPAPVGVRVQG